MGWERMGSWCLMVTDVRELWSYLVMLMWWVHRCSAPDLCPWPVPPICALQHVGGQFVTRGEPRSKKRVSEAGLDGWVYGSAGAPAGQGLRKCWVTQYQPAWAFGTWALTKEWMSVGKWESWSMWQEVSYRLQLGWVFRFLFPETETESVLIPCAS